MAISVFDQHINLFISQRKTQVNDIPQFLSIDDENFIARHQFELFRQTVRIHAQDDSCILLTHTSVSFVSNTTTGFIQKQRSDACVITPLSSFYPVDGFN